MAPSPPQHFPEEAKSNVEIWIQSGGPPEKVKVDYYPDECPVCHRTGEMKRDTIAGHLHPEDGRHASQFLQIIYRCPGRACGSHFVVHYKKTGVFYKKFGIFPKVPVPLALPKEIAEISPAYVKIANQTHEAEGHNLDQIVGVGYRKALEFLIKDYCISKVADDEEKEKIKDAFLGTIINNYIEDPEIMDCASRATWLGNDETHYLRKWEDHDIEDLKILIDLTIFWIHKKMQTEKFRGDMRKNK